MPYQEPDDTDPMILHGVALEVEDEQAVQREMAACFIEELLRIGFDAREIIDLFRSPSYQGPHMAYLTFGEQEMEGMIRRQLARRPSRTLNKQRPETEHGRNVIASLPVLNS